MGKFLFPEHATPLDDVSYLKLPWVHNLKDLNRAEAENISQAQKKYLQKPVGDPSKWFHLSYLKKIHLSMFGNVWEWAGKWRISSTKLSYRVMSWSSESSFLTSIERSARIHHQLVSIHPFENGNGRFARLVADRYLLAHKKAHPVWPSEIGKNGSIRREYIEALKDADKGNYQPLIEFIENFSKEV